MSESESLNDQERRERQDLMDMKKDFNYAEDDKCWRSRVEMHEKKFMLLRKKELKAAASPRKAGTLGAGGADAESKPKSRAKLHWNSDRPIILTKKAAWNKPSDAKDALQQLHTGTWTRLASNPGAGKYNNFQLEKEDGTILLGQIRINGNRFQIISGQYVDEKVKQEKLEDESHDEDGEESEGEQGEQQPTVPESAPLATARLTAAQQAAAAKQAAKEAEAEAEAAEAEAARAQADAAAARAARAQEKTTKGRASRAAKRTGEPAVVPEMDEDGPIPHNPTQVAKKARKSRK